MKKMIALMVICAAAFQLASCAGRRIAHNSVSSENETAAVKAKYSDTQIAGGKTIFANYCNKCHDYKRPDDYSVKEWNKILPVMARKAHLNTNDAGLIRAWIITNAKTG
jgi:cytochrome c5